VLFIYYSFFFYLELFVERALTDVVYYIFCGVYIESLAGNEQ